MPGWVPWQRMPSRCQRPGRRELAANDEEEATEKRTRAVGAGAGGSGGKIAPRPSSAHPVSLAPSSGKGRRVGSAQPGGGGGEVVVGGHKALPPRSSAYVQSRQHQLRISSARRHGLHGPDNDPSCSSSRPSASLLSSPRPPSGAPTPTASPRSEHSLRLEVTSRGQVSSPREACRRRLIASPRQEMTSPRHQMTSPRHQMTSPREQITSPRQQMTSPRQQMTSPRQQTLSTRQQITSPRQCLTSPRQRITSPRQYITSPRQQTTSLNQHITSPRQNSINSTRQSVTCPRDRISRSEQMSSAKQQPGSSRQELASPGQGQLSTRKQSAGSGQVIVPPIPLEVDDLVTSPRLEVTISSQDCNGHHHDYPQRLNLATSDEESSDSDYRVTTTIRDVIRPGIDVNNPRQHVSSPRQHVSSPRQHISSPRQHVSSPRQHISSPRQIVSSPRQHASSQRKRVGSGRPGTGNGRPGEQKGGRLEGRTMSVVSSPRQGHHGHPQLLAEGRSPVLHHRIPSAPARHGHFVDADHLADCVCVDQGRGTFLGQVRADVTRSASDAVTAYHVTKDDGGYLAHLRKAYLSAARDLAKIGRRTVDPQVRRVARTRQAYDHNAQRILDYYSEVDISTQTHSPRPPADQHRVPSGGPLPGPPAFVTTTNTRRGRGRGASSSSFSFKRPVSAGSSSASGAGEKGAGAAGRYVRISAQARLHASPLQRFYLRTPSAPGQATRPHVLWGHYQQDGQGSWKNGETPNGEEEEEEGGLRECSWCEVESGWESHQPTEVWLQDENLTSDHVSYVGGTLVHSHSDDWHHDISGPHTGHWQQDQSVPYAGHSILWGPGDLTAAQHGVSSAAALNGLMRPMAPGRAPSPATCSDDGRMSLLSSASSSNRLQDVATSEEETLSSDEGEANESSPAPSYINRGTQLIQNSDDECRELGEEEGSIHGKLAKGEESGHGKPVQEDISDHRKLAQEEVTCKQLMQGDDNSSRLLSIPEKIDTLSEDQNSHGADSCTTLPSHNAHPLCKLTRERGERIDTINEQHPPREGTSSGPRPLSPNADRCASDENVGPRRRDRMAIWTIQDIDGRSLPGKVDRSTSLRPDDFKSPDEREETELYETTGETEKCKDNAEEKAPQEIEIIVGRKDAPGCKRDVGLAEEAVDRERGTSDNLKHTATISFLPK